MIDIFSWESALFLRPELFAKSGLEERHFIRFFVFVAQPQPHALASGSVASDSSGLTGLGGPGG